MNFKLEILLGGCGVGVGMHWMTWADIYLYLLSVLTLCLHYYYQGIKHFVLTSFKKEKINLLECVFLRAFMESIIGANLRYRIIDLTYES